MAAIVDEVRRERSDRVGAEAATLRGGREEEVDAGVAEVGFGLLDRLDVADDGAVDDDDEALLVRVASVGEVRLDAREIERPPPAGDRRLREDRGERRGVGGLDRSKRDRASVQLHGPSLPDDRRVSRPGYDGRVPVPDPDDLLADLDPAQREAVTITSGPLCILAGAGSGKTRVISRRVAYALATGVVRPRDVLVVTFTDKAAGEMAGRLAALGHRGVAASTFHAAALRQLRHFWPRVHGTDPPEILASKAPILAPLAAGLPGGYRYLAVRDLAAEIEWAKARRIGAAEYEARAIAEDRDAPLPPDLMAGLYRRYEAAKTRAGRIDFEDMLERTIGLIEDDESIAFEVRDRYRWFSVDEFQDTNPLQAALLDAWLGGRDDLAVVGDEDQTIYTFTGASSDYLIGFVERYPRARLVRLETNYRSTPEVLGLANRVLAAGRSAAGERGPGATPRPPKRLVASLPGGPAPEIGGFPTDEAEMAGVTAAIRALAAAGTAHGAMAVLVRTNAQLPAIESAMGAAGIPFHVRGERFFARPEVRRAIRVADGARPGRERRPARRAARGGLRARARRPARRGPRGRDRRRAPWRRRDPPRAGRGARPDRCHGGRRRVPRGDRPPDRDRGRWRGGRRRAPDLSPGEGSRVGRRLPPRTRGRDAADPPGEGAGRAGRGAAAALRRDHQGATVPVAVVGDLATRDVRTRGRRSRSRFLDGLVPPSAGRGRPLVAVGPGASRERPAKVDPADRSPLSNALRAWRTARARADAVAPFIVFHDSTIEAIAERRPRSIADLRRVPGVGPTKLDRYGEEIIGVVVRES